MDTKVKIKHEKFMRLALKLAQRAKGKTSPNPLVGALVVKNGKIISRGYHRAAGLAHAEVVALDKAGSSCRDASLYVTLEPCCHFGRTGPCVQRIVDSGIKEVIFAIHDPNPLNNGNGAKFLRQHKVRVISGILAEEAKSINQVFIKYITRNLPFVTVKIAQSLDGKIATKTGEARWISQAASRNYAHKLRAEADAILVGRNTVQRDDPLLSCRLPGRRCKQQPKKIVVDSRLLLSGRLNIFSAHSPAPVIVATTRLAHPKKIAYFQKKAQVIIAKDEKNKVDLRDLMRKLAQQEITHVLIEGGGEIIASALSKRLVDRMIVFIAPKIIGGRDAPTAVEGEGIKRIKQAIELKDMKVKRLGQELVIEGRPI